MRELRMRAIAHISYPDLPQLLQRPSRAVKILLSTRSRSSLPRMKCGTHFSGTGTFSPVFGLRPVRAGRWLIVDGWFPMTAMNKRLLWDRNLTISGIVFLISERLKMAGGTYSRHRPVSSRWKIRRYSQ